MKWILLVLAYVLAQPSTPLLPAGVTIDMVTQIQVETGGTVEFLPSTDNSSSITNRLPFTPIIKFDATTGILTVTGAAANGSSMLKPGLMAAFLAIALCAFNSNNKHHSVLLLCLGLGLGVVSAGSVIADVTIRVPGCFHTEGVNGNILVFDEQCLPANLTIFQAPAQPIASAIPRFSWVPVTPNVSFLPARDHGQHYLTPENQYEVWRNTYGRPWNATEKANFLDFTEGCRTHNLDQDRLWTAACNQFSHLSKQEWQTQVLANNAATLANANAGRRLLSEAHDPFAALPESHQRRLLQSDTFTWVGTGHLTAVKDQGRCGDCYAHSTSSQMEAHLSIVQGTVPVELSREQLKSCSSGSPGCNGGYPPYMYTYALKGLGTEAALPYNPNNDACPSTLPPVAYKDAGTGYVTIANNELAFKTALQTAPVAVTVCADTWSNYAGGVFTNCAAGCSVDHAVMLVGYGVDANLGQYWLIQNSWSTNWGESGFIRLARSDSNVAGVGMCGLTIYSGYQASSPSGSSSANPGATDCVGSWSGWTSCSVTCGGGSQTRTWSTSAQPTNGGASCPSPTTQQQSCNTQLCPGIAPANGCLHLSNTQLGANGDGDYTQAAGWDQNWCGSTPLPQYTATINGNALTLFFYATNCYNNVRQAGQWGLGPAPAAGAAYQWSGPVTITNGVIPGPRTVTNSNWMQITTGTTC